MRININYQELCSSLFIALLAFITPIKWLLIGAGALIVLDTVTGVYKAKKRNHPITSKRFGHVISKFVLYQVAIISAYIVELMVNQPDYLPIARIVTVGIALTELKSILENLASVTGANIWSFLLAYLKRKDEVIAEVAETLDNTKD